MNETKRIISLSINKSDELKYYGIIFNNNKIEHMIAVPNDYLIAEFMNIVMLEYKIGDIITFDKHVFGVAIDDYLKYRKIKNIIHVNEKDMLSNTICKCKEILFDAVIGDNIKKDSTLYYEIKKIRSELNNIKIIQDDNYTRYAKIDKNIGMGRACCFIYYINIINQLASLTKE